MTKVKLTLEVIMDLGRGIELDEDNEYLLNENLMNEHCNDKLYPLVALEVNALDNPWIHNKEVYTNPYDLKERGVHIVEYKTIED